MVKKITLLDFKKTKQILRDYKIPLAETRLVESRREGLVAARAIGWPVVLKGWGRKILHRTERELIAVRIKNGSELKEAFGKILKKGNKDLKGVLVQKMIKGVEVAIGMKRDLNFGPVLMFGLGGVFIEVLKDVSFGIAPLSKREAMAMIKEIKGYKILKGYRGRPPVNFDSLVKVLLGVSKLSIEHPEIKEVDFNPIFCEGKKVQVADFKLMV